MSPAHLMMNHRLNIVIGVALAVIALGLYARTMANGFVYDDEVYVVLNPHIEQGLTLSSVAWALKSAYAANWHPLTWLSHLADVSLYGMKPAGHHATNVVLHAANVVLLFFLLMRMSRRRWRSALVAALFAVHPLRIESVAWVAERKDVLSTLFWLLTMLAYVQYTQFKVQGSRIRVWAYLLVVVLFTLGLMAKPMLVTLPFVLLLIDHWPLGRLHGGSHPSHLPLRGCTGEGVTHPGSRVTPLTRYSLPVIEKLPLMALAAGSSIITYIAQQQGGAMKGMQQLPFGVRAANVPVAYVSYIGKMLWPRDLAVFYPHPVRSLPVWQVIGSVAILAAITFLVIRARRNRPYLAFGWLWYLGTLVPVIGLVQVGAQAMADRYTYVPLIGLFVMIVWAAQTRPTSPTRLTPLIPATALIALGVCTFTQLGYWTSAVTLFGRALAVTEDNFIAHVNLGIALADRKDTAQAIPHYYAALELKPHDPDTHKALADSLIKEGRPAEAIEHYRRMLEVRPRAARVRCVVADLLADQRRLDEAIAEYEEVIRIKPDFAEAHTNFGVALVAKGRSEDAIGHYQEALRLKPGLPDVHYNLGIAYAKLMRFQDSVRELRLAVEQKPDDFAARQRLTVILFEMGDYAGVWEQVIELRNRGHSIPADFLDSLSAKMPPPSEFRP